MEPPGSTYWDASTLGKPLVSGWEAIIKPAGVDVACMPTSATPTCGFREAVLLHHEFGNDNETLTAADGTKLPLVDKTTGSYRPGEFALNYRSEPFRNRLLDFPKEKSHAYSSYTFGEPSTPMMRGYLADPTKIRIMHVGAEKFHIFHLHGGGDRWRFNPVSDASYNYADTGLRKDPPTVGSPSQRLDSQSIGPGESYNLEIEGGAGGVQQSAGDFLYHCHIAKHYVSGMWAFWRVYDTRQPDLVPLADRPLPPKAVESTRPDRQDVQRQEDHGQEPRLLDPAAAAAVGHPGQQAGRHGAELEGRRDGQEAGVPRCTRRPDGLHGLPDGLPGTAQPAGDRPEAHGGQPPGHPVQPGQRSPGVPVAPDPHRRASTVHAERPLGGSLAR